MRFKYPYVCVTFRTANYPNLQWGYLDDIKKRYEGKYPYYAFKVGGLMEAGPTPMYLVDPKPYNGQNMFDYKKPSFINPLYHNQPYFPIK